LECFEKSAAGLVTIYISVVVTPSEDFVGLILGDVIDNVSVLGRIGMEPPSVEQGALAMPELPDGNKYQLGMPTERSYDHCNHALATITMAMIHSQP
jgi:hypothetical protein